MDYKGMKNVIIILLVIYLFSACKPQPDFSVTAQASIQVLPNQKNIPLGTKINLKLNMSDVFPTISGGTVNIPNATLSTMLRVYKVEKNGGAYPIISASANEIKCVSNTGSTQNDNSGAIHTIKASYQNNKYLMDFDLIPQVKDTFMIQLSNGMLFSNQRSIVANIKFDVNQNNLEVLPSGSVGSSQVTQTYAFIVE